MKTVFFDYDGVLTTDKTGSLTTCKYLSRHTGIGLLQIAAAFRGFNRELTLGRVSHADVWPAICSLIGREIPFEVLAEAFKSTPPNSAMFTLAEQLKRFYSVGIITDNKNDRMSTLRSTQRLDELFDPIVVSAEVGSSKTSELIFLEALRLAGTNARDALFIDNSAENLVVPQALGMKTVLFDDVANDVDGLRNLLRSYGVAVATTA